RWSSYTTGRKPASECRSSAVEPHLRAVNHRDVEEDHDEPADEVPQERDRVAEDVVLERAITVGALHEASGRHSAEHDGHEREDREDAGEERKEQQLFILGKNRQRL